MGTWLGFFSRFWAEARMGCGAARYIVPIRANASTACRKLKTED
jgi:hypothetical protein